LYWIEGRPYEDGRDAVCSSGADDEVVTFTPRKLNARSRCNEYGGGALCVHGSAVFFSNFDDQRLYRQESPNTEPFPITPAPAQAAAVRFADGRVTPDGKLIVSVRERHEQAQVINDLVVLASDGSGAPTSIASGSDFYSFPRISPNGRRLAWTQWRHPNMPWDGCELLAADLSPEGRLSNVHHVAGGDGESVFQPEWSPESTLYLVSDRTGWWNLYRESDSRIEAACPVEADFGTAQWVFGLSRYAFLSDGRVAASYTQAGIDHLVLISNGEATDASLPYTYIESLCSDGTTVWFVGATHTEPPALIAWNPATGETSVLRRSSEVDVDEGFISIPRAIEFPTAGGTAHALFYPPSNRNFKPLQGEKPPLRVAVHGGPTDHARAGLDLDWQFHTSRGWAVVLVNYGGSTGYGRDYRNRLRGGWGVVDRQDAVAAARFLTDQGEADPGRVVISGGSAGGYTTLLSLCLEDTFAAGISYFGISDLLAFATGTHHLESHYCDRLVGVLPDAAATYRERSAVHLAEGIHAPVLILQGTDDEVVLRSQAAEMIAALDAHGSPYAYLEFAGEGHGFRRDDTLARATEAELYFLARVFDLPMPEGVEEVPIQNL
jgi:dipeptidyl aminopeptidase/acylaminoacyl peptidase